MDILASEVITQVPWWTVALLVGMMMLFILGIAAATNDHDGMSRTAAILACCCAVAAFVLPREVPSGKMKYTVEITDPEKYKELIDRGYNLDKLYETRDIYEMSGEPIDEARQ